ncbi:agglutinin biogenesis protein MshB [Pseudoalteromonas sp. MMG010]|uniref:agglutinin biogenesis protein MshB n=1 Tax=Pseudoalteromonas sp. MMG010 TaxID=2822685 RepID=UPI001B3A3292|nr:agglutinin biogenesis protein MshB [Pseudoalteromonas sp. MMG010]MBQ4832655.1 agglutinin biogenesis protein MshB [Pseudoalteromonas sp. MMG010]
MNTLTKAKGFSLFELVIVVIVLMVLLSVVVPNFENVKDEAHSAVAKTVAGGFATAVTMVRGQWELTGRPKGSNGSLQVTFVNYGGVLVGVDGETGYPTTGSTQQSSTQAATINANKCQQVFNAILQDAPSTALTQASSRVKDKVFLVRYDAQKKQCIYYLTHYLEVNNLPDNGAIVPETVGFSYFPEHGKVVTFNSFNN